MSKMILSLLQSFKDTIYHMRLKLKRCEQCGGRDQVRPEWVTLEDTNTTDLCYVCWKALPPLVSDDKHRITECTAQEFRDYIRENGLNIDFISDRTLDAEDIKFRHRIRRAFLLDLRGGDAAEPYHNWTGPRRLG